jgi:GntR family transcriptional regulator, rspAB operon transcriptional repressor
MDYDFTRKTSWTSSDKVYYGLRNSIINLELKPGDEINIKNIAENLGVSRSPVREAVLKLEKEGLADVMPQKGTCVSRIDLLRVHEELFLRKSLEEKALEIFIQKYTDKDISRLKESIKLQKESLKKGDFISFLNHDDAMHGIFFEGADKNICWDIVQSMSGHYRRIRLMTLWNAKLVSNVILQHAELIEHVCNKNVKEALRVCNQHLEKLLTEERDLLESYRDYFTSPEARNLFVGNDL